MSTKSCTRYIYEDTRYISYESYVLKQIGACYNVNLQISFLNNTEEKIPYISILIER